MNERRDYFLGVFDDGLAARDAIQALKGAGFRGQDISILMPDSDASKGRARAMTRRAGMRSSSSANSTRSGKS